MQDLTKYENWMKRYLKDCDDLVLQRELGAIRQKYKQAIHNDIWRSVKYNRCANDETVLKDIKP
jgi:hypothetical protein